MALQVQRAVLALVARCGNGELVDGPTPAWLQRPGLAECGAAWSTIQSMYTSLTGRRLPNLMPQRERRSVDAVPTGRGGRRIVEVDDRQHFTPARANTLGHYPPGTLTGFDRGEWQRCSLQGSRPPGGGFARPCPPLFPDAGGRHVQRAFRDALADLVPVQHGWLPTLRIAHWEVDGWLYGPDAMRFMSDLLKRKLDGQNDV